LGGFGDFEADHVVCVFKVCPSLSQLLSQEQKITEFSRLTNGVLMYFQ